MTLYNDTTSPSGNQACMSAMYYGCLRLLPRRLQESADLQQCVAVVKSPALIEEFRKRVDNIRAQDIDAALKFALRSKEQPQSVELKALAAIFACLSQAWSGTLDVTAAPYAEQAEMLIEDGVSDDLAKIIVDAFAALDAYVMACAEQAPLAA